MFARRTAQGILQHITGQAAIFTEPSAWVALFTTAPTDDTGAGAVEVTGGSYARKSTASGDWNAATNADPAVLTNANAITFVTSTANWGTVVAFGLYDAATTGNLLAWDYLGNFAWQPCTISSASPGVFTAHAHGYSVADTVVYTTLFGGTAPTFSQSNLTGLLAVAHAATDTFDVTNAATAVNTSATGNGLVRKVASQSVPSNIAVTFSASNLILSAL